MNWQRNSSDFWLAGVALGAITAGVSFVKLQKSSQAKKKKVSAPDPSQKLEAMRAQHEETINQLDSLKQALDEVKDDAVEQAGIAAKKQLDELIGVLLGESES